MKRIVAVLLAQATLGLMLGSVICAASVAGSYPQLRSTRA